MRLLSLVTQRSRSVWFRALLAAALFSAGIAFGQGTGFWHTSGNRILDANNKQVRIAGINWYGFETVAQTPGGLYAQDFRSILSTAKSQGFNTVRLPLSSQMIESPSAAPNIQFANAAGPINADLKGLSSLQVLDKIVDYAGTLGLKVILDHHRSEAGNTAESNGLWYTDAYSEAAWIADWTALAGRYLGNPTVIGFDLHNEPHSVEKAGACWDCGGPNDWHLAAQRAGNAVLAINPDLLLFVEGTDLYHGDYYWWGGNLEGVSQSPVVLTIPNHLVYSAHDYGPHETRQSWFNPTTTYTSLAEVWSKHWGYISQNNIAPVWLGEFGTTNNAADLNDTAPGSQGQWFQSLVAYLKADPNLNWNYWALNGEDAYALLDANDSPQPVSAEKQAMLAGIRFPLATTTAAPVAPAHLTATSLSTSSVALKWALVAGSGATFALFFGTSAGNQKTVLASGLATTTYEATNLNPGTKYFFTVKSLAHGVASPASNEATVSTRTPLTPPAPASLAAVTASISQINVAWAPGPAQGTPGVTYTLYGGTSAHNITNVVATGIGSTTYLVTGLNAGTQYFFNVKAITQGIASPASNIASATTRPVPTPDAPAHLSAHAASSSRINLAWSPVTAHGVTYTVYSGLSESSITSVLSTGLTAPSFQATGLKPSTEYFYAVKAVVSGTSSVPSSVASAISAALLLPAAPAAAVACHVEHSKSSEWNNGFVAALSIANTGTTPILDWRLTFTYSGTQQLTRSWNSTFVENAGTVSLTNAGWNRAIAPGAVSTGIGFQASYSGSNPSPKAFYVNGILCS